MAWLQFTFENKWDAEHQGRSRSPPISKVILHLLVLGARYLAAHLNNGPLLDSASLLISLI